MTDSSPFVGLTMPVFNAFGWTGEQAALKYALDQLTQFIHRLHADLPNEIQQFFPYHNLDIDSQTIYLATHENPIDGLFIAFHARPLSLEISVALQNKESIQKGLKNCLKAESGFFDLLSELEPSWSLHIRQMEFDPETNESTTYQDILKSDLPDLTESLLLDSCVRAEFLNDSTKWLTPLTFSRRIKAEQVSAMGLQVITVLGVQIRKLFPLLKLLSTQSQTKKKKAAPAIIKPIIPQNNQLFSYSAELKPLHIRRGFINLTPVHWPMFATSPRVETTSITLMYENKRDLKSSVWRMQPHNQARIVLSEPSQVWLETNFSPGDSIEVTAIKEDEGITLYLK